MMQNFYDWLEVPLWQHVVESVIMAPRWSWSGHSGVTGVGRFWFQDLGDQEFFRVTMMDRICAQLAHPFQLEQVYANGQTHGLSGSMHQDVVAADPGQYWTLLYYANLRWDDDWGGATVLRDPATQGVVLRHPTPNSAMLFDSSIWHAGLEPTRHADQLRVTVAWKLRA